MTEPAEVKVVLVKARDLIANPTHWIKGRSRKVVSDGEYGYCAMGALDYASGNRFEYMAEARRALGAALPVDPQLTGTGRVVAFNDNPATTHADMLRAFDAAIAAQATKIGAES